MTYRTEFPDFDPATMTPMPEGFEDTSWHNNSMPSFQSDVLGLVIYVDFADEALREWKGMKRFSMYDTDGEGALATDEPFLSTDDWSEVLAIVTKRTAEFAAFRKSRRFVNVEPETFQFHYLDGTLHIDVVTEEWPEAARGKGAFHLLIANQEWLSDNLNELEARLCRWALSEGYDL